MKNLIWFGFLIFLYIFLIMHFCLSTHPDDYFKIADWRFFMRLSILVAPFYLYFLWIHRKQMISLNYHIIYLPFIAWVTGLILFGKDKGGMKATIIEPPIIILLMGIYLE